MKIVNQSSLTSTIILPDSSEQEVTTLSNERVDLVENTNSCL